MSIGVFASGIAAEERHDRRLVTCALAWRACCFFFALAGTGYVCVPFPLCSEILFVYKINYVLYFAASILWHLLWSGHALVRMQPYNTELFLQKSHTR